MPFALEEFAEVRPFANHLSSANNFSSIRRMGLLRCASEFINGSGQTELLRERRRAARSIESSGVSIQLQNQSPLQKGNISFEGGWNLERLVECLNGLVFFWPGVEGGPIKYGVKHSLSRLWGERPIALRIRTSALLKSNPETEPLFCRFNSGSPRCVKGRKSPRGPETFLAADTFSGTPSQVVELVFRGCVRLPETSEFRGTPEDQWRSLFDAG